MDWREQINATASAIFEGIVSAKSRAGIGEWDRFLKHQRRGFGWAWGVYDENPPTPEDTPQSYRDRITALIESGYPATYQDYANVLKTEPKEIWMERFKDLEYRGRPADDDLGGIKSGIDMFLEIVQRAARP